MIIALLAEVSGKDAQTIFGVAGSLAAGGGGVWVIIRLEKDLLRSYRIRLVELEKENERLVSDRDTWRERFFELTMKATQPKPVSWKEIDELLHYEPDAEARRRLQLREDLQRRRAASHAGDEN